MTRNTAASDDGHRFVTDKVGFSQKSIRVSFVTTGTMAADGGWAQQQSNTYIDNRYKNNQH
jgi:hypothetical protein